MMAKKQAIIVSHIFLSGYSFKKNELKTAVAKGVNAIITRVLATFVFCIEMTKVVLPKEIKIA